VEMVYVLTKFWVFGLDLEEASATLTPQTSNRGRNDLYFAFDRAILSFWCLCKEVQKATGSACCVCWDQFARSQPSVA
jgi:hypothetical protein